MKTNHTIETLLNNIKVIYYFKLCDSNRVCFCSSFSAGPMIFVISGCLAQRGLHWFKCLLRWHVKCKLHQFVTVSCFWLVVWIVWTRSMGDIIFSCGLGYTFAPAEIVSVCCGDNLVFAIELVLFVLCIS